MNNDFWQLRAAGSNYFSSHQYTTELSNRITALAKAGLSEPLLDEQLKIARASREAQGKLLRKIYKQYCPEAIYKFQQETCGLGELYVAQLIGICGDLKVYTEAWWDEDPEGVEKRVLHIGEVKTLGVRELWAYCGHGDPTRKRRRGGTQEEQFAAGNPRAKSVAHMMAEFALRQNGEPDKNGTARPQTPYYWLYVAAKEDFAQRHAKGTEDEASKMRCHNHGLRRVAKAILKDLWRVQHGFEPVYGAKTEWHPRPAADVPQPASTAVPAPAPAPRPKRRIKEPAVA